MTQHTPGPWLYFETDHDGFEGPTVQSDFGLVAKMPEPPDAEGQANARLIAAAPDLLEAAKLGLLALDDTAPDYAFIRDAIAKARG